MLPSGSATSPWPRLQGGAPEAACARRLLTPQAVPAGPPRRRRGGGAAPGRAGLAGAATGGPATF